jgi:hypothetical protein
MEEDKDAKSMRTTENTRKTQRKKQKDTRRWGKSRESRD